MNPPSAGTGSGFNIRMSSEEMLSNILDWNLGCDTAVLNRLKDYSENMLKRAEAIKQDCNTCSSEMDLLQTQVQSITNQFNNLANDQFVENCVEEFEEREIVGQASSSPLVHQVKTKAEKEAELIMKMKESIQLGIDSSSFRDHYTSVPKVKTAHIIGTSKFFSSRYCGLIDESHLRNVPVQDSVIEPESLAEDQTYLPELTSSQSISIPKAPSSIDSEYQYRAKESPLPQHSKRESSLSSEDNFIGTSRTPLTSSSNSIGTNHSHDPDLKRPDGIPTTRPPISILDDLNKVLRARVPPPPSTDSASDDDFKPRSGAERNLFADIDDEDIFSVKPTLMSTQPEPAIDDIFYDSPVVPKIPNQASKAKPPHMDTTTHGGNQPKGIGDIIRSQGPPKLKQAQKHSVFADSDSDTEGGLFSSASSTSSSKRNSRVATTSTKFTNLFANIEIHTEPRADHLRDNDSSRNTLKQASSQKISGVANTSDHPVPNAATKSVSQQPNLKQKSQKSIFDESDSDDDLFSFNSKFRTSGKMPEQKAKFDPVKTVPTVSPIKSAFGEKSALTPKTVDEVLDNTSKSAIQRDVNSATNSSSSVSIASPTSSTTQQIENPKETVSAEGALDISEEKFSNRNSSSSNLPNSITKRQTSSPPSLNFMGFVDDNENTQPPGPSEGATVERSQEEITSLSPRSSSPDKAQSKLPDFSKFAGSSVEPNTVARSKILKDPHVAEASSSFDNPPNSSELLSSLARSRPKIIQERRKPSRKHLLNIAESFPSELTTEPSEVEEAGVREVLQLPSSKDNQEPAGIISMTTPSSPPVQSNSNFTIPDSKQLPNTTFSEKPNVPKTPHVNSETDNKLGGSPISPTPIKNSPSNSTNVNKISKDNLVHSVSDSASVSKQSSTINISQDSQVEVTKPAKDQPIKKVKQSIFDESDSDEDLFLTTKSTRNSISNMTTNGLAISPNSTTVLPPKLPDHSKPARKLQQPPVKTQQRSIFADSDSDTGCDLFSSISKTSKQPKQTQSSFLNGENRSSLFQLPAEDQNRLSTNVAKAESTPSTANTSKETKTVTSTGGVPKKQHDNLKQKSIFDDSDSDSDLFLPKKSANLKTKPN